VTNAPGLAPALDELLSAYDFSGVVRIDDGAGTTVVVARGMADRAAGLPNAPETRFAVASATKGVTALVIVSLIVDGMLTLETTARSLLGTDLPLIDETVTVGHLLTHRSGIGDYLDEDAMESIADYVMSVPVHQLDSAEAYLAVLDGHPQAFRPGQRFAYNNGAFVVLALLAERAAGGVPYAELVRARVTDPAQMVDTGFVRTDEVPSGVATGYLGGTGLRTNVLHLPVLGVGDGGLTTTVADVRRLWEALFAGRIVPSPWVSRMTAPSGDFPTGERRYGLGFWLSPEGSAVELEGYDAGISFRSVYDPTSSGSWTVVSNTSDGAWPVARDLATLVTYPP
jgi:CubicO group peptidase (beta-lactamase class C family)